MNRKYIHSPIVTKCKLPVHRAAQFSFRPGDYLPVHFGLNFRNPSYIYIRACCIIYRCSLYHSVHKSAINNPNLCIIGLEIFNRKYWFDKLSGHWTSPPSPPLCAALPVHDISAQRKHFLGALIVCMLVLAMLLQMLTHCCLNVMHWAIIILLQSIP